MQSINLLHNWPIFCCSGKILSFNEAFNSLLDNYRTGQKTSLELFRHLAPASHQKLHTNNCSRIYWNAARLITYYMSTTNRYIQQSLICHNKTVNINKQQTQIMIEDSPDNWQHGRLQCTQASQFSGLVHCTTMQQHSETVQNLTSCNEKSSQHFGSIILSQRYRLSDAPSAPPRYAYWPNAMQP